MKPQNDPLKVVLFGGSNSFTQGGYVPVMVHRLQSTLNRAVELINEAKGDTFSHYGLYRATNTNDYVSADVVVIEYAVNDMELIRKGHSITWQRAYEGLIRRVRKANPGALLVSIILAHRDVAKDHKSAAMWAFINYCTSRYGGITVDIEEQFSRLCPPTFLERRALYRDGPHYSKEFQVLIGVLVSDEIVRNLGRTTTLPAKPLDPEAFQETKTLTGKDGFSDVTLPRTIHINSHVEAHSIVLNEGDSIHFSSRGRVLALITTSTRADGLIEIKYGKQTKILSTYRKALTSGKFPFLMNNILVEMAIPIAEKFREGEREFSVRLLSREEERRFSENNGADCIVRNTTALPPTANAPRTLHIVDVLYTGELDCVGSETCLSEPKISELEAL